MNPAGTLTLTILSAVIVWLINSMTRIFADAEAHGILNCRGETFGLNRRLSVIPAGREIGLAFTNDTPLLVWAEKQ
jgi:hypothetical protein